MSGVVSATDYFTRLAYGEEGFAEIVRRRWLDRVVYRGAERLERPGGRRIVPGDVVRADHPAVRQHARDFEQVAGRVARGSVHEQQSAPVGALYTSVIYEVLSLGRVCDDTHARQRGSGFRGEVGLARPGLDKQPIPDDEIGQQLLAIATNLRRVVNNDGGRA